MATETNKFLRIAIGGGEKTCASEPGVFCPWMRTTVFGGTSCHLFGPTETTEPDGMGWTLRHPDCLAAEELGATDGKRKAT